VFSPKSSRMSLWLLTLSKLAFAGLALGTAHAQSQGGCVFVESTQCDICTSDCVNGVQAYFYSCPNDNAGYGVYQCYTAKSRLPRYQKSEEIVLAQLLNRDPGMESAIRSLTN